MKIKPPGILKNTASVLWNAPSGGRFGEIDLIGYDGDTLVFFEVKYRASSKAGFAEEAVTPSKRSTICKVADYYRVMHGISDFADLRFDVIAINEDKIHWIQNAFNYC